MKQIMQCTEFFKTSKTIDYINRGQRGDEYLA